MTLPSPRARDAPGRMAACIDDGGARFTGAVGVSDEVGEVVGGTARLVVPGSGAGAGLGIERAELEEIVLSGLKGNLMAPDLVREFIRSYHDRLNERLGAEDARREGLRKKLSRIDRELAALVAAVKAGLLSDTLQAEYSQLEGNKRAIEQELATEPPPPVRLHPNLAETYRKKVENLTEALNAEETRQEAGEIIRGLIDEIRLVPDGDELRIHLKGELAEML